MRSPPGLLVIVLQLEDVAKALVKGMQNPPPVIIPVFEGKMTSLAKRWVPILVERMIDRTTRQV